MYREDSRIINQKKNKPPTWEWKDDLVSWILYAKDVVRILEAEKDRRYNEADGKWKEQFDRNLLHYKERLYNLEEQRRIKIKDALMGNIKNEN
jgi:hypothetical protein